MTELLWFPEADEAMGRLEADLSGTAALRAVRQVLGRLEIDSTDPRLGTRQFQTEGYGHVRATPCRHEDWYVLWCPSADDNAIEILLIAEFRL